VLGPSQVMIAEKLARHELEAASGALEEEHSHKQEGRKVVDHRVEDRIEDVLVAYTAAMNKVVATAEPLVEQLEGRDEGEEWEWALWEHKVSGHC
jgi:hypothetical protein